MLRRSPIIMTQTRKINFAGLEKLQRDAFDEWSSIIKDPAIPSADSSDDIQPQGVTGVSISFAGDWLPGGRNTFTNVSRNVLNTYLNKNNVVVSSPIDWPSFWNRYGNLFLAVHWK